MPATKRKAEGQSSQESTAAKVKKTNAVKDISIPTNTTMPDTFDFIEEAPEGCAKVVTWNVNSLPASCKKGFKSYLKAEDPDIICLQETKVNEPMVFLIDKKWYPHQYWHCCKSGKKGYAGTAVFSKFKPLSVSYGLGNTDLDNEGRTITLEFEGVYLVACYVPNAGDKLVRLDRRQKWDVAMNKYLGELESKKPVIYAGDLNVAHNEIDLARPDTNHKSAGFTDEEREGFTTILKGIEAPRIDVFRDEFPDSREPGYTYFGYRFGARSKGLGWRLDYFVSSESLRSSIKGCVVRNQCYGASDHIPLMVYLKKHGTLFPKAEKKEPENGKDDDDDDDGGDDPKEADN